MTNCASSFSFPLVALLAGALAPAQKTADATTGREPGNVVQLGMPDCNFGLFLLAISERRVRMLDADLLVDAVPVLAIANGSQLVADLWLPDSDLKFHWQSLAVDGTKVRLGAIQDVDTAALRRKAPALLPDHAIADQPADQARLDAASTPADTAMGQRKAPAKAAIDADRAAGDGIPADGNDGAPVSSDLPISLVPTMSGHYIASIHASFTAPNDGYALRLLEVVGPLGGTMDVYLYRKLPGEGEGHLDIVEEHSVKVMLRASRVRVFLGEGTAPRPKENVTWRRFAVLGK